MSEDWDIILPKNSLLHIPVTVKSKNIFCHCVQIFKWILGICEPNLRVKFDHCIALEEDGYELMQTVTQLNSYMSVASFFSIGTYKFVLKKSARK